jgi:hypothetical protein
MTDVERGIGGGPWYNNYWNSRSSVLLTNLDRPSQTWNLLSYKDDYKPFEGAILSFEGVTTKRFSLEVVGDKLIFDEINLDDAEYEP